MQTTSPLTRLLFAALLLMACASTLPACSSDSGQAVPEESDDSTGDAGNDDDPLQNYVDSGPVTGDATTGEACSRDTDCESGNCLETAEFPGGYCTTKNCDVERKACTGDDAVCVNNGMQPDICLDGCTSDEECREGYACMSHPDASSKVCVKEGTSPGDGYDVGGDDGDPDGSGCESDGDCAGGACVTSSGFSGGYCTSLGCQQGGCSGNSVCVSNPDGPNMCLDVCSDDSDCRSGYECKASSSVSSKVCVPGGTNPDDGYDVDPGGGGTGSSCSVDAECSGGRCIEGSGFSGGYCTTIGCSPPGSSSACVGNDGVCIGNDDGANFCAPTCSGDGDCRSGYTCEPASSAGGQRVCVPSGTDPDDGYDVDDGPSTGSSCQDNADCGSGVCMRSAGFEGGYCTQPNCDPSDNDSCSGDATCLNNDNGPNVCLSNCSGDSACRSDYECEQTNDGDDVCVPDGSNPDSGYDVGYYWDGFTGDDCDSDSDCVEGSCVQTPQFPDGYCSTLHCHSSSECSAEDAECKNYRQGTDMCMKDCNGSCRHGYHCEDSVCVPDGSTLTSGFEPTRYDLNFLCLPEATGWGPLGTEWTFKFKIDRSTDSYLLVPLVSHGTVKSMVLNTPTRRIDISNTYKYHNTQWGLDGSNSSSGSGRFGAVSFTWPTQVPYAPQFSHYVDGGGHTLEVTTSATRPCLYVVEQSQRGSTVDLNIYPVDQALNSSSLSSDPNWSTVMNFAENMLQTTGVSFDKVRYENASSLSSYGIIRSYDEMYRLMGEGELQGGSRDDYMSVDIFLVEDIRIQRDQGIAQPLGVSGLLPGAAGLHGNTRNGVVVSTEDLGQDNELVGYIFAHELSHFLGLRHTTELAHNTSEGADMQRNVGTVDPISDTPVCSDIDSKQEGDITECPDYQNLMFPLAPPANSKFTPSLTRDQGYALGANPLVKP